MKNLIKIAPAYSFVDGIVYDSKGMIVPQVDGQVKLVVNKVWMPYDMADLVVMTEEEEADFEANIPAEKVKKEKAPKTEKVKKEEIEKVVVEKGPGVIATILACITQGNVTAEEIHQSLVATFPDRDPDAMKKTVAAQIGGKKQPTRLESEKKITFVITEVDGKRLFSLQA